MTKNKSKDILILLAGIILICVVYQISLVNFSKVDLTEDNRFTLSEETEILLEELDDVIEFKVYLDGEDLPVQFVKLKNSVNELLNEFEEFGEDNIEFEFINIYDIEDKKERESEILRLQRKGIPYQPVTRKTEGGTQEFYVLTGLEIFYKGKSLGLNVLKTNINGDHNTKLNYSIENLEYELSNAIRKLNQKKRKNVAFLQLHNELNQFQIQDFARSLSEYYTVGPIFLKDTTGKVNIHALEYIDVLVIAKPLLTFTDKENFVIDQFIMNGGKVLFMVDGVKAELDSLKSSPYFPAFAHQTKLENLLFKYGVKINSNIIEDLQCTQIPYSKGRNNDQPVLAPWVFFPTLTGNLVTPHQIVKNLDPIKFEFASTLDTVSIDGVRSTILLKTSGKNKYRKTPTRIGFEAAVQGAKIEHYKEKSKSVAMLLEGNFTSYFKNRIAPEFTSSPNYKFKPTSDSTRIIVIGDGDVAKNMVTKEGQAAPLGTDRYTNFFYDNRKFLLNCVNYLSGDEDLINVRSKRIQMRLLDKKKLKEDKSNIQFNNIVLPPLIILILSITFYLYRRMKYSKK